MKDSRYQQEIGATAACTKRMMEETKEIGQNSKKGVRRIVSCLIVGLPPRRRQKLQRNWVLSSLVW